MQCSRRSFRWRRGFSLPTLLITLVIVGVLGAVSLVYQRRVTRSAATAVMKADLREYAGAWARASQGDSVVPPIPSQFLSRGVRPVVQVATPTSRVLVVSHPRTPEVCRVVVETGGAGSPQCGVPEPAAATEDPSYTVQTERVTRVDGVSEFAVVVRPGSWTNVPLPIDVPAGALPPMTGNSRGSAPVTGEPAETPSTIVLTTPRGEVISASAVVARDSGLRFTLPEGSALPEDLELLGMTASGRLRADGSTGGGSTTQMFTTSLSQGANATVGLAVTFATTGLTVGGTAPTVYNWNFGDGTFSASAAPSKTFVTPGTYTVRLTMANAAGTVGTPLTRTITVVAPPAPVGNQAPVAVLTSSLAWVGLNTPVTFSGASSTDADGSVMIYRFEVNGVVIQGTNRTMTTSFRTAGTYTARLTVTDNAGATHVTTMPVTVSAAAAPFDAARSSVTVTPTSLIAGASGTVIVTVRNVNNAPMANQSVALSTTAGTAALNLGATTLTTNAQGVATTTVTAGLAAGSATLAATRSGATIGPLAVSVVPGSVAALIVEGGVGTSIGQSGLPLNPLTVQTASAGGQSVAAAGRVVTVGISTGTATLSGALTATTNSSGAATFSGLTLTGTAGSVTLRFTSPGLTAVDIPVTLGAGVAATLAMDGGQSQTQTVGLAVTTAPRVRVTDAQGNPVSGRSVSFSVTAGGGSLTGATTTTNASGVAVVGSWTLGTMMGSNTLTASSAGLAPSGVVFTATGVASNAATIGVFSGDLQTGTVGTTLSSPLVVQVIDQYFNPVAGTSVTFTPASGSVGTTTRATDASGFASTSWTLGTSAGSQSVSVASTGLSGSPLNFTATGTAGAATALSLTTNVPTTAAVGAVLSPAPSVQLLDAFGNAVSQSGISITVSRTTGDGTLGGTTSVTTNASGLATFSTLTIGGTAGAHTLGFTASGLMGVTSSTVMTVNAASATLSTVAVSHATIQAAGATTTSQITVTARNSSNQVMAGQMVTITATGSNNTFTASGTTNASGVFTSVFSSTRAEVKTISASIGGMTVTPSRTITVTAGPATKLLATGALPTLSVGATVSGGTLVVTMADMHDNPTGSASPQLQVLGTLTGHLPANGVSLNNGAAFTFQGGVSLNAGTALSAEYEMPSGTYTMVLSASGLTSVSVPVTITQLRASAPTGSCAATTLGAGEESVCTLTGGATPGLGRSIVSYQMSDESGQFLGGAFASGGVGMTLSVVGAVAGSTNVLLRAVDNLGLVGLPQRIPVTVTGTLPNGDVVCESSVVLVGAVVSCYSRHDGSWSSIEVLDQGWQFGTLHVNALATNDWRAVAQVSRMIGNVKVFTFVASDNLRGALWDYQAVNCDEFGNCDVEYFDTGWSTAQFVVRVTSGTLDYTQPGTYSFTVPRGVSSATVRVLGAGGAGFEGLDCIERDPETGGCLSWDWVSVGGSAARGAQGTIAVSFRQTVTVVVGAPRPHLGSGGLSSVLAGGDGVYSPGGGNAITSVAPSATAAPYMSGTVSGFVTATNPSFNHLVEGQSVTGIVPGFEGLGNWAWNPEDRFGSGGFGGLYPAARGRVQVVFHP